MYSPICFPTMVSSSPSPSLQNNPEAMISRPDSRALLASTAILTSAMQRYV